MPKYYKGLNISGLRSTTKLSRVQVAPIVDFVELTDRGLIDENPKKLKTAGAGHRKRSNTRPGSSNASPKSTVGSSIDMGGLFEVASEYDYGEITENAFEVTNNSGWHTRRTLLSTAAVIIPDQTPNWTRVPALITVHNPESTDPGSDNFGNAVAIYGETVVAGAKNNGIEGANSGRAYIINALTGTILHTLTNPNMYSSHASDFFGYSVDVSETHVIIGAPYEDSAASRGTDIGAAYIFDKSTGALVHSLSASTWNRQDGNNFGFSVAIDGNYAVVGAPGEDQSSTTTFYNGGTVYIYDVTTGEVIQTIQASSSEYQQVSRRGWAVDISGDYVIMGAPYDVTGQTEGGRAYLWHIPTSTQVILGNPKASSSDYFGYSVAISGDYAVVGAMYEDESGSNSGHAYVYRVSTGALIQSLENPNTYSTVDSDGFGRAVAISENYIMIGARDEDSVTGPWNYTAGSSSGAVYIFSINEDAGNVTFPLVQTLFNPNAVGTSTSDWFGDAVALTDTFSVASAAREDGNYPGHLDPQYDSGKVYIFDAVARPSVGGVSFETLNIRTNNEDPTRAVYGDTITLTMTASASILQPTVEFTSGGLPITGNITYENTNIYNDIWTAKYTVSALDPVGDIAYSISFTDIHTNVGNPTSSNTTGSVTISLAPDWNTAVPSLITIDNPESTDPGSDNFGNAVAIYGETAVVGAKNNGIEGANSGRAYIINAATGTTLHTLTNPNMYSSHASDFFGYSVDVSETHVIIGAPYEDSAATRGTDIGAAYIFDKSTGALVHSLNASTWNRENGNNFGFSVAIDGNYAVVGAPGEDQSSTPTFYNGGAVYIYDVTTGEVVQNIQSSSIEYQQASRRGWAVDISGDYVIMGAPYDVTGQTEGGRAYLWHIPTGTILTLGNPKASSSDYFGYSVAISGDYAVVGAMYEDESGSNSGHAYVYRVSTGALIQSLENPNEYSTANSDGFGKAVAISDNKIIVGARDEDSVTGPWNYTAGSSSGTAYIFSINEDAGNVTFPLVRTLSDPNPVGTSTSDWFGDAVAMYEDRVIVSAAREDGNYPGHLDPQYDSGKVYIFDSIADDANSTPTLSNVNILSNNEDNTRAVSNDVITLSFEADKIIATPVVTFYSGDTPITGTITYENTSIYNNTWTAKYTVSGLDTLGDITYSIEFVDSFGNVGVPVTAGSGSVTVSLAPDWNTAVPSLITIDNPESIEPDSDNFGNAVAIYGETAVIGAKNNGIEGANSGRAYIINAVTGTTLHTLTNPNMYSSHASDFFGYSVDVSETHVIIGAPYEDQAATQHGTDQGAAYIFDKSTGALVHSLNASTWNRQDGNNFGFSVAIDGNYAVVGAPGEDQSSTTTRYNGGAVYIYDVTTGEVIQNIQSSSIEYQQVSRRGWAVDISGDYVIMGAPYDVTGQSEGGRAYLWHIPTGTILTLGNPKASSSDYFGYSVAISGDYAVVGAMYEDETGSNSGYAYVYRVSTGALIQSIANPNTYSTVDSDGFGRAVAISDNKIIVGARSEDSVTGPWNYTIGNDSGAVYIFDAETGTLERTIEDPNPVGTSSSDWFGDAVAMYEDRVIVSAAREDGNYSGHLDPQYDAGKVYIFDSIADDANSTPTLSNVNILSNNEDNARAVENDVITLSFEADKIIATPVVTFYSGSAAITNSVTYENTSIYNNTWTAKYTSSGLDTAGDITYSIEFVDSFGNVGVPVTAGSGSVTKIDDADWSIIANTLTIDNPESTEPDSDNFGNAVAIYGETAVVGAKNNGIEGANSGRAYIINAATGTTLHTLTNPNMTSSSANDFFGYSVDVSETHVIIGAPYEDSTSTFGSTDQGAAYIFDKSTGALVHSLNASTWNRQDGNNFGFSVAIDGNYAVVGAPGEDQSSTTTLYNGGTVYIYDVTTGEVIQNLQASSIEYQQVSRRGWAVDISGDYVIMGAPYDVTGQSTGGRAYLWHIPTGTMLSLGNPKASSSDYFGYSVAISGDYAVVGAMYEDETDTNSGHTYVYRVSTGALIQSIANPNTYSTANSDGFGRAVAISDNKIIVGARDEDDADGTSSGTVYIFDAETGVLESTITNPNVVGTSSSDWFGGVVAMYEDRVIVGAAREDGNNPDHLDPQYDAGKVYIIDAS